MRKQTFSKNILGKLAFAMLIGIIILILFLHIIDYYSVEVKDASVSKIMFYTILLLIITERCLRLFFEITEIYAIKKSSHTKRGERI